MLDFEADALLGVKAPTLLIVGGADYGVIELNERAYRVLTCEKALKIVPRAAHLFEEPGALEQVAELAADWFTQYLKEPAAAQFSTRDPIVYMDRTAAGRMLARGLMSYAHSGAVVLGIPRGGVPVATHGSINSVEKGKPHKTE